MAKKKIIRERKPTPARFLLSMAELETRMRRQKGQHTDIAVQVPEHCNNLLWIQENFFYNPIMKDLIMQIELPFISNNIRKRVNEVPSRHNPKCPSIGFNRIFIAFEATSDLLQLTYNLGVDEGNVLVWFYSPSQEGASLFNNFHNHMYYDEATFPAFIIDKWSAVPSFVDHYIPLSRG